MVECVYTMYIHTHICTGV